MRTDVSSDGQPASPWTRTVILAVACGALIVTISMGVRQSFGLFMQPIGRDFGMGRESFALAVAVQNLLFGLVQPFIGALSDRWGARCVLVVGAVVYAAGLVLAAFAQAPATIMAALGIMVGLALSATTFVVVLGAVGRLVSPAHRSTAFGLVTAGGSFGQFAVVPIAQQWISGLGWRDALVGLAALFLVLIIAAWGLARPQSAANGSTAGDGEPLARALAGAFRSPHYGLLNLGFFVCGFHIAFVGTHFPAYLVDQGLPAWVGAYALALVGLFNIAGSYLFGVWGGRQSRPRLLSALYAGRALMIAVFLVAPLSPSSALVFAAAFGFLWLGTVPLTSGAVANMFGLTHLSTLYGIVFLSHQIGSFLGAWSAGRWFDITGNYQPIWIASIVLGLAAAVVSFFTDDRHVPRAVMAVRGAPA
ncbi:MFS transporter [Tahibacter amnicola]|uniref:MFS transporter n=1 Tax=Tahibacter amnicola TaxID=2976241 RepID=A0ABY6BJ68_9GAMM|nr:MFS transporter [Tahibacter amnicola]UXI70056.1 MFS transporter [Tahibacter amnicola]